MADSAGRRRLAALLALVAVSLLIGAVWKGWEFRCDRIAIADIEDEIDKGRDATAAGKLRALLARRPDWDEALYLLGTCEAARGRTQPADDAWARVAPDSAFAARAVFGRMQIEMDRGRFSKAEEIIREALDDPRVDAASLPILLGPIYCHQGRLGETLRLIETRWNALNRAGEGASELAINLVRAHIDLQQRSLPTDLTRSILDQAASAAPDDDRVWLGKAHLAIRTGSYDEALRWLDRCLRRRPEDIPVWRCRLDWAVTTHRVAEAREALRHLPAEGSTPAEIRRLAAWFAARSGDRVSERDALERLLVVDPADTAALDRLAVLADQDGQPARAAERRSQKGEIDRLEARYVQLYDRNQPKRDAVEMASLAEQFGRLFQARAWLTVAIANHPDRDDLRRHLAVLEKKEPAIEGTGRTLADVLAPDSVSTARSTP